MIITKDQLKHINSIVHEGKVIVFGTDANSKIWYTVKQDGFEDSYLNKPADQRSGWEEWKELLFPNEDKDDASVVEKETDELTYKENPSQFILRSRYKTQDQSAVAPVQLLSGLGHIYVFRQSKSNTLLVDRFVLDGMTNELTRKLEVRFKRSRQKHKPTENMKMSAGGFQNVDSLDYRDANGNFFYEPTTELSIINNLKGGWFSVVQVPTNEHEKYRWHIFAYNSQTQQVELITIRTSDEGLFDVKNYTVMEPKSELEPTLVPRSIPGIIRRTLAINGVKVTNGLSATKYDIQQEQQTKAGPQLMKAATRIMLAIPTDQGTATISFAIASDGTLSQITETPTSTILRSQERDVLLPLNTLDAIKSYADTTPNPKGTITGLAAGTAEENAEDLVKITSDQSASLESGNMVEIRNTQSYDGVYTATKINESSFTVDHTPQNLGNWEKEEEEEGGLIFEGMITAYEKLPDGKLKVTAYNHGLESGDEVLIQGTSDYNDTFPIRKIDEAHFVIERSWAQSEAVNVKLEALKRRGIILDGSDDYVAMPEMEVNYSQGFTVEAWVKYNSFRSWSRIIDFGCGENKDNVIFANTGPSNALTLSIRIGSSEKRIDTSGVLISGQWMHLAATADNAGKGTIYVNGRAVQSGAMQVPASIKRTNNYVGKSNWSSDGYFDGQIADLRIWQTARTEQEIKNNMHLQLTGKEVDLVGYWRLGAILEGNERKVIDFSVDGRDGIVNGGAYVGGITFNRNLRDGTSAVKYSNDELFAVSQRATYVEEFEFKVNGAKGSAAPKDLPVTNGLQVYLTGETLQADKWLDKSGKNLHALIAPGSVMPIPFDVLNYNNKNFKAARFNPSSGMILPDSLNLQTPFTAIIVDRYYGNTKGRTLTSRNNNWLLGKWGGNNGCFMEGWLGNYPSTQNVFTISTVTLEGTSPKWYVDGVSKGTSGGTASPGRLGFCKGGAYSGEVSEADIACVLIYNRVLTNDERQLVEAWIAYQYGISVTPDISKFATPFDINNADGTGKKIFQMSYWGKANRSADEKISISANQDNFADLGEGWYRASCQFTIPDGAAMMRCFEIANIRGAWDSLEIRKHRIRLISDAITQAQFNDSVSLTTLGTDDSSVKTALQTLSQKEIEEADLLKEKSIINDRLAIVEYLAFGKTETEINAIIAAKELEKTDLTNAVNQLRSTTSTLGIKYNVELNNPLNYWCYIEFHPNDLAFEQHHKFFHLDAVKKVVRWETGHRARFIKDTGDLYYVEFHQNDLAFEQQHKYLHVDGDKKVCRWQNGHRIKLITESGDWRYIEFHSGDLAFEQQHKFIHVDAVKKVVRWENGHRVKLNKTADQSNTVIPNTKAEWDRKVVELQLKEEQLSQLRNVLTALKDRAILVSQLEGVNNRLKTVQTSLNEANTQLLNITSNLVQTPQTMPVVHSVSQGYQKGLESKAALLKFIPCASRLTAIETCEGNVQLSYFDTQGCMRQTNYDATADSRNATFEQWLPDGLKSCLNFNKTRGVVKLNSTIAFNQNWSVEAWFAYPFAENLQWHVLTSSEDNKQQIAAYKGKYLGTRIDGLFYDSGFSLEQLSQGWHHLTTVGNIRQSKTLFYIDGKQVGSVQAAALSQTAIELDGTNDFISLPAMDIDYSRGFTVEAWVKYEGFQSNSRIIDFGNGQAQNNIVLGNDGTTNDLIFSVINSGNEKKLIAAGALDKGQWLHLAATIDTSGKALLYKNGQLIQKGDSQLPQRINRTQNYIGKSNWSAHGIFDGLVKEIRIWNVERSQLDIQINMGKTLKGDEAGLAGNWYVDKGAVNDKSSAKRNGTIHGDPQAIDQAKSTVMISNVSSIGYVADTSQLQVQTTSGTNSAMEFNGTNSYVDVPPHANPTQAITISCWAKSNTANWNEWSMLVSKRDAFILHPEINTKKLQAYFYIGGWQCANFTLTVDITQWHHYAGSYDGTTIRLFVDGVQVAQTAITGTINADTGRLTIGKNDDGNNFFNGQIAEVRIWNKARTAAEIQSDMAKTLVGNEAGLIGYWPLADGSAKDYSASGLNGTINGTTNTVSFDKVSKNILPQAASTTFGKLTELRFWNIALSDEEIAVNSKTLLSGNEPGLLAYYPMNEAKGIEVRDYSGNNNHGTLLGANWWGCSAPIGSFGHKVMQFDGVNDNITLPDDCLLSINNAITIEFWAKGGDKLPSSNSVIGASNAQNQLVLNIHFPWNDGNIYWDAGNQDGHDRIDKGVQPQEYKGSWTHWAFIKDVAKGQMLIYRNGTLWHQSSGTTKTLTGIKKFIIGSYVDGSNCWNGSLAEFRIWNKVCTDDEIINNMHFPLSGKEAGLVGYWPLNEIRAEGAVQKVIDLAGNNHGIVKEAIIVNDNTLPINGDALVSAEYNTISIEPSSGLKMAMMRRFFASPVLNGVNVLPEKRIEQLELLWIGNAQFAPTLLGYIEGAPPIPSENLTEQPDYSGATSVELTMTEDVEFSWHRSQDAGLGASFDMFIGADVEGYAGLGWTQKMADVRAGFKGNLDLSYQFSNESNITSSSSLSMADRLELRGTPEEKPNFPHLGNRFIPKNVGYALVISSLADVFITKLARSGRMIGYDVQPVEGIPPDVNTITFLMNPAYTMQGSLDGMTGTQATSQRFFKHVPEMRSQYGSLYPASYYRLKEAYDLKHQIEQEDKRRESYFAQFNVRLLDETSLARETESGAAPQTIGVNREEDKPATQMTDDERKAQDQAKLKQIQKESEAKSEEQEKAVKKKQAEIDSQIADMEKRAHASDCFAGWQKKMENIQVRAGKRNIVNTYVWDADGGLRSESQSFASTAEHTIGGSFSLDAGLGFEGAFGAGGFKAELTALVTVNMTQTMSKTESKSKGIQLNVDLSGVEHTGITDYNDYPIMPGEKVDRYRFMSFFLDNSTNNFHDFFSYVVDPEWLRSNDEEARALRQAMGKANKTWRVLHRVTYVERPALMGFGRSMAKAEPVDEATSEVIRYFQQLDTKQRLLEAKMDEILALLKQK